MAKKAGRTEKTLEHDVKAIEHEVKVVYKLATVHKVLLLALVIIGITAGALAYQYNTQYVASQQNLTNVTAAYHTTQSQYGIAQNTISQLNSNLNNLNSELNSLNGALNNTKFNASSLQTSLKITA